MKMNMNCSISKSILAVTGALLFSVTSYAASAKPAFTMTVISDDSYGHLVKSGAYEAAIGKISNYSKRRQSTFEAQTNLCVAYTKSGDFARADNACNGALESIQRQADRALKRRQTPEHLAEGYRAYLAIALSNRGVLSAVRGYSDKAREDFLQASELQADLPAPIEVNLARLDVRPDLDN